MTKLLLGTAMSLALVGSAMAADLPPAPPPPAPAPYIKAPPPAWSWTGCYIGGNVGGGWTTTSFYDPTLLLNDGNANGASVVGGGQVGCDYQLGGFVFGVQGLFDGTGIKGTGTQPGGLATNNDTIPWLATATGRIGFTVMPTTLVYAKGGAAWVQDNFSGTVTATSVPFAGANNTATGWTVGGGFEHMFMHHWSVFVEYDYLGFGTKTVTTNNLTGIGPATFPINVTQNVQMAIVGINFRF
jgi:outer membrane immunogenic protein